MEPSALICCHQQSLPSFPQFATLCCPMHAGHPLFQHPVMHTWVSVQLLWISIHKQEQHPSPGSGEQQFAVHSRGAGAGHHVEHQLLLHPSQCPAWRQDSSHCLPWVLVAASSVPTEAGCSPRGELRHLIFGKGPHSHENQHSFYTTI